MALITLQPLVADQAYMPLMKAMNVPFHMLAVRWPELLLKDAE